MPALYGRRDARRYAVHAPLAVQLRADLFPVSLRTVSEIKFKTSPLWLLMRVNAVSSWRKLLATREQSRLLTSLIGLFIIGYLGLSF
jgi:hypothetical protein